MLKDILVPLADSSTDDAAIRFAIEIGRSQDARVRIIETVYLPPPAIGTPDPIGLALFNALLFDAGRPVVVVPPHWRPSGNACAVVGWKDTPNACRALHAAIPLLQQVQSVQLVEICRYRDEMDVADTVMPSLIEQLHRWGIAASAIKLAGQHRRSSEVLVDHANAVKASLVVVGGYGHSRLREWAVGGMTSALLLGAAIPVLYAH